MSSAIRWAVTLDLALAAVGLLLAGAVTAAGIVAALFVAALVLTIAVEWPGTTPAARGSDGRRNR